MLKLNHLTGFGSGAGAAAAGGDVTSYVFDGASYLRSPYSTDWYFNLEDFTIEAWIRTSSDGTIVSFWDTQGNQAGWSFSVESGVLNFRVSTDGTASLNVDMDGTTTVTDNTWYHVAVVRDGSDFEFYVDGVAEGSASDALKTVNASTLLNIGCEFTSASPANLFTGYIDELRISKSSARYTTGFTPETTQFTSDANTSLLIHYGEAYTGALTEESDQPEYVFDGTGDYLSIPDHADWDLTGDFTIEWFMKVPDGTPSGGNYIWSHYEDSDNRYDFRFDTDGSFVYRVEDSNSITIVIASNASLITANTWHHVALVRSSDTYYIFVDGTDQVSSGSPDSSNPAGLTGSINIGRLGSASGYFTGELSEIRVSNTARYTSGFTPTTERFTSDANTKLLIHGDEYFTGNWLSGTTGSGATFTDSGNTGHTVTEVGNAVSARGGTFNDSGNTTHVVTENGNAKRDIAQEFKLETDGVGYFFDELNDYLQVPDHADFDFPQGDFTIEMFLYSAIANVPGKDGMLYNHWGGSTADMNRFFITSNGCLIWQVRESSTAVVAIFTANNNLRNHKWHHVAVVRENDNYFIYVDGTDVTDTGSPDSTTPAAITGDVFIGARGDAASDFGGYLDEIRVSNIARYPSGTPFTPTTSQFTSDANTKLLIHCGETKTGTTGSGATFTDSGNTGHTVTENGNAIESTGNFYKF